MITTVDLIHYMWSRGMTSYPYFTTEGFTHPTRPTLAAIYLDSRLRIRTSPGEIRIQWAQEFTAWVESVEGFLDPDAWPGFQARQADFQRQILENNL